MAYIYTIQDPLTDEVVYVGCTSYYDQRISTHLSSCKAQKSPIQKYVYSLKENGLSPKFEILDMVDENEVFCFERYWISQMHQWGFKLLNVHKLNTKLSNQTKYFDSFKDTGYTGPYWEAKMFKLGTTFTIEKSKRNAFLTGFRHNKKKYKKDVHMSFKQDGEMLIGTVVKNKPKAIGRIYVKKGYPKTRKTKVDKSFIEPLRVVGGEVESRFTSVQVMKSYVSRTLKDIPIKRFKYTVLDNGHIQATRIK